MKRLTLDSPAKLNLFLDILGKRPDGYHELVTVMQKISLCDTVKLELDDGPGEIEIASSAPNVPSDRTNLGWRAAELFFNRAGIMRGCRIEIIKRIPAGAGMGGGSSNAATVLVGLNRLCGGKIPDEELRQMAAQLGSDVAFFVFTDLITAHCTGRGEVIERALPTPRVHYVAAVPPCFIPTREVYAGLAKYDLTGHRPDYKILHRALERPDFRVSDLCQCLFNRLECVVQDLHPEVFALKRRMLHLGCLGALMSGSGSTVYGLVSDAEQAGRIRDALAAEGYQNAWSVTSL